MARAKAHIGTVAYKVDIETGVHRLVADESPALGGQNAGPAPYDLLLSSLGACTAITLQMYAGRKGWDVESVDVDLHLTGEGQERRIERVLSFTGVLTDEQRARLADIAERTPVTLTLKNGIAIRTTMK